MRYKFYALDEKIILPVNPPKFGFKTSSKISVDEVISIGEISTPGKKKLKQASINSFFPKQLYPFAYYENGFIEPMEYVRDILKWEENGQSIIVEVDGFDAIRMYISAFEYGVDDGSGDIYYNLSLKEDVSPKLKVVGETENVIQENIRIEKSVTTSEYVVKSGDTLSQIAKKHTGNSGNWKKIAVANGINDPRALQIGQKLVIT